jgi:hypothetical protein
MGHKQKARAEKNAKKVRHVLKSGGYVTGKQNHSVKSAIKDAVHKHEEHDHPGKPLTKLKHGGCAEGEKSGGRLDKKKVGGRNAHTHINIVVPQGKSPVPMAPPPPVRAGGAPGAPMPPAGPRPPMPQGGMPGGAPPMGGMAGGRPPGMKNGGSVKEKEGMKEKYGSASGEGRLAKIKEYGVKKGGNLNK